MFGRVWSSIKSAASSVASTVKKVCTKVKETANKVWNAVTGKDKIKQAEELHQRTVQRFEDKERKYQEGVAQRGKEIELKLKQINGYKQSIFNQHFPRFAKLGNRLHNVRVAGSAFEEFFDDQILEISALSGVRSKQELFKIDFNNLSFKEFALSVLTLGFFSRKKAKESLQQVQDEANRIEEEITKMDAHLKKIDQVISSISNVAEYFEKLIRSYDKLLDRFEYGINTQRIAQLGMSPELFKNKLDFRLLPVAHIEEFQALFNLSIVLKQMSRMAYLSQSGEIVEDDTRTAGDLYQMSQSLKAA
ncbi:hypothetical protein [Parendozoicomonas haliclonae]|uniref:Uncharacterized protein n=1 Tax=Parendozoicomonas haliclonae TaxID=1960125 RepID=A0A1X7AGS1_9GAMM|nr:hypothetical protein [Parendozoicomonas haliclonae]SMA39432.1 hypothetical protein EHSB41UT_01037 [Parendozoicomonas haliclonae]